MSFRLPHRLKADLTQIAAREGVSRSALVVRVLSRFVESYPLDDVD